MKGDGTADDPAPEAQLSSLEFSATVSFRLLLVENLRLSGIRVFALILIVLGGLYLSIAAPEPIRLLGIAVLIGVLLLPGVVALETWLRLPAALLQEHYYRISSSGVDVAGPHMKTHFQWSAFQRVRESPRAYHLYVSRIDRLIVPKASLDQADLRRMSAYVENARMGRDVPRQGRGGGLGG